MRRTRHWSVTVTMNGEALVTIESNCLSGKSEFTDEEAQVIRDAATHLKAFIGEEESVEEWTAEDAEYFRSGTRYPGQ